MFRSHAMDDDDGKLTPGESALLRERRQQSFAEAFKSILRGYTEYLSDMPAIVLDAMTCPRFSYQP